MELTPFQRFSAILDCPTSVMRTTTGGIEFPCKAYPYYMSLYVGVPTYSVFWSRISDGPIKRSSLSEAALVSEGGKAAKL